MDTYDVGPALITSLRAIFGRQAIFGTNDSALFVKAALALRAWYRHQAFRDNVKLEVSATSDVLEVYGSLKLVRNPDGRLKLFVGKDNYPEHLTEVTSLGRQLAEKARCRIQKDYRAKAQEYVLAHISEDEKELALPALASLDDYVSARLNVNWWRNKSTVASDARVLSRLLWDAGMLDREVLSLAIRVGGFRCSLDVYNECLRHRQDLIARVKEAPHMAPWLMKQERVTCQLNVSQTVWKDLKDAFIQLGGTPQAWRWLCGQGHSWFRFVRLTELHVATINGIASLQLGKVPLHKGLMTWMFSNYPATRWYEGDPRALDVFKAAMVANKKRKLRVSDFSAYSLIGDYLWETKASTKGATWASLMRKQQIWHRENAEKELLKRQADGLCFGWAPLVQSVQQGDLVAVSLNTSDALWQEGVEMQHCVSRYDKVCFDNESRIYSICRNGSRLATLEIRLVGQKWTIGQLFGYRNTRVKDRDVIALANRVLSACRRAPALNPAENHVIRQPKPGKPAKPILREFTPIEEDDDFFAIPF